MPLKLCKPDKKCTPCSDQQDILVACSDERIPGLCRETSVNNRLQWGHAGKEANVVVVLLSLDEAYRAYYKDWVKELDVQRIASQNLCTLSEVFCNQLINKCKPPEMRSTDADTELITKYQLHYQIILASNITLQRGLKRIRAHLVAFRKECAHIDLNVETAFTMGDAFHKPIKFFIDLAEELFDYFHSSYLKLDCGAHLLDPSDMTAMEQYQKILVPCEEFGEYLEYNLSYCHCLRAVEPCRGNIVHMHSSVQNVNDGVNQAKKKRCAQRLLRMTKRNEDSFLTDRIMETIQQDSAHELRMEQLSMRLAQLRQPNNFAINIDHEQNLVQQVLYALSPSLMPVNFRRLSNSRTPQRN